MSSSEELRASLQPGRHFPVYLWAGPGTVRMNQLKFMRARVDEAVHLAAHASAGAAAIVKEAGCKWAYLMYDWGFPPEIEREDWISFLQAAQVYHAFGARVFAYIQTSNCVYSGSFAFKDWYANNPQGRKIHYYTGRYMTCWESPEWFEHLGGLVLRALESGADGVFFDNPWHAAQPLALFGAWLGPAGCYCPRCRERYRADEGAEIPTEIDPGTPASDRYLLWRASRVTAQLARLSALAREIKPNVVISANDFDAVMRPSYITYGIDLPALAKIQDVVMIEDYGLPSWSEGRKARLANNALTLRTARALCGSTPLSVDPYDRGIGFDSVFPARRYLQSIAEASACSASAVIKATEFVDSQGRFTLLTDLAYTQIRVEIGRFHRWLSTRTETLERGENRASVGLLYPARLHQQWGRLSKLFFGCAQALTAAHIPWRVVLADQPMEQLKNLIVFDLGDLPIGNLPPTLEVIELSHLPGWQLPEKASLLHKSRWLRARATQLGEGLVRSYFSSRATRRILDGIGMMAWFTKSPLFLLPKPEARATLLAALTLEGQVRVEAEAPVLVEIWQHKGQTVHGQTQIHLVNYANQPQTVQLHFPTPVSAKLLSPDLIFDGHAEGQDIQLELDVYTILLVEYKPA
jgi:hypothetical protein